MPERVRREPEREIGDSPPVRTPVPPRLGSNRMSEIAWGDPDGGLRLGLAAAGGSLEVSLANVGDKPLTVLSYIATGGRDHLDWFTVTLAGGADRPHQLQFIDDRDRSAKVREELEPGGSLTHVIDLADWAARPINAGRPLAAGHYRATASYQVEGEPGAWTGRLDSGETKFSLPG
ncbi:hypothetical protein [Actinoplanes sp. NPDC026619]|uniref:hypothetical protein n=1 Tax=Actinoplanes sp. NPDC026619 TaxID=3155798 RepID=UPI0033FD6FC7